MKNICWGRACGSSKGGRPYLVKKIEVQNCLNLKTGRQKMGHLLENKSLGWISRHPKFSSIQNGPAGRDYQKP